MTAFAALCWSLRRAFLPRVQRGNSIVARDGNGNVGALAGLCCCYWPRPPYPRKPVASWPRGPPAALIRSGKLAAEMTGQFDYIVEIKVPPGGLGFVLENVRVFHREHKIEEQHFLRRRDAQHDYLRWGFADFSTAEAFASQFRGTVISRKASA